MRILEIGNYYPTTNAMEGVFGGIQNNIAFCCRELIKDHAVEALVSNTTNRTRIDIQEGIRVVRAARHGIFLSQDICPAMLRHVRQMKPDLIHLHAPNAVATLACLAAGPSVPVVVTHHLDIVRQKHAKHLVLPFYRRVLARAEGIIVYTQKYAHSSEELRPWLHKVTVIPHGVDDAPFADNPDVEQRAAALRRAHAGTAPTVAYLGRLVRHKGIDVLIRAIARMPDVHALIAGDGPIRSECEQLARDLGVAQRAHFLGRVDEPTKIALYRAGDVFVLPSTTRAEAFGQVQVEAQLSRRPVVTMSLESGTADVTVDGETGILVPPHDADALACAVRALIQDPALRQRMGEAGYQRARRCYTKQVVGQELRRYFAHIAAKLEARRRGSPSGVQPDAAA
jgi:rhamnosyl/mannosyltransferase